MSQDNDTARPAPQNAVEHRSQNDIIPERIVVTIARRGSRRRDAAAGDPDDVEVAQGRVEEQFGGSPGVGAGENDCCRVGAVVGGAVGEGIRVGAAALELALNICSIFFCFEVRQSSS